MSYLCTTPTWGLIPKQCHVLTFSPSTMQTAQVPTSARALDQEVHTLNRNSFTNIVWTFKFAITQRENAGRFNFCSGVFLCIGACWTFFKDIPSNFWLLAWTEKCDLFGITATNIFFSSFNDMVGFIPSALTPAPKKAYQHQFWFYEPHLCCTENYSVHLYFMTRFLAAWWATPSFVPTIGNLILLETHWQASVGPAD